MTAADLSAFATLIAALAVATQKLVDIVKAWIPFLDSPEGTPEDLVLKKRRERWIQVVAGLCGVATAYASWPAIETLEIAKRFSTTGGWGQLFIIIVVGLLASGTSGPWNDLSTWLKNVKEKSAAKS